jgi:hypothetical protein
MASEGQVPIRSEIVIDSRPSYYIEQVNTIELNFHVNRQPLLAN